MSASALALGVPGTILTFLPQELVHYVGLAPEQVLLMLVQLCGALYLAFALLNWMAKANLIGGIYSRPVAMGNFLHFMMGALLLLKAVFNAPVSLVLVVACLCYCCFALLFGFVLFRNPFTRQQAVGGVPR